MFPDEILLQIILTKNKKKDYRAFGFLNDSFFELEQVTKCFRDRRLGGGGGGGEKNKKK